MNDGTVDAVDVDLQGLTETDRRRLGAPVHAGTLAPSEQLEFPFASRFTLSGPGNIVVSWRTASDDTAQRTVLRVPAE